MLLPYSTACCPPAESFSSQYRCKLDILLPDYAQQLTAQLRPDQPPSKPLAAAIATWKQSIVREQMQLLHLCEWKIWLNEARNLLPALRLVQHRSCQPALGRLSALLHA